ncbi:MAG: conjugal transfer protein TraG N-terminal domain-containing protein [Geovibrio sp.]|nr:conjugal transfer protein TraG N-terminal domain-containing protein [Geovibrio sp.]
MKKILFLIMLAVVPASAFAEYNFYTYGNGAMLHSTYNAVAMIFNDSGFINLTRFVFILAFLASFYMTAFLKRWDVLKYAIISFFILGLFLYSKDRVVIHDVIQDELYVVDNVPKAFGFLGESVSSAGHFITEKFDTAFAVPTTTLLFGKSNAMPPNLTYSGSGFAGPFKMIKDLGSFELPDEQIQADFYEYVKKCAKWDVMGLNSSEMKIFKENPKLSSTDVIPNGLSSRFYVPVTIGGVKSQCATYYVANLYPRIVASIGGSEAILSSEPKLLKYMSGLSSSMAFFTGESLTTYNAMTQSAVVKTAIRSLSGSLANGREEYNQFMAELGIAKFEQQGEVISRVAMKLIPIFRNVMEVLMIATLPIVFLLFLLPNGYKLIWEYVLSLIWLQLWNPILAVMQMVMNLSAVMEASAAGKVTEIGGFTIHSFGYWGDFSNSYLAVAGYMMISVPMLAHLVLRGGKFMGAQLGQGLASAAMGAGAMSVDPNAVKGAGYLTAEEKSTQRKRYREDVHDTEYAQSRSSKEYRRGKQVCSGK